MDKVRLCFDRFGKYGFLPNLVPEECFIGPMQTVESEHYTFNSNDRRKKLAPAAQSMVLFADDRMQHHERRPLPTISYTMEPWVYPVSPIGDWRHWFLDENYQNTGVMFPTLGDEVFAALRHFNGYLLIDQPNEGFDLTVEMCEYWNKWAHERGIAPCRLIYATGNGLAKQVYKEIADSHGWDRYDRIKVVHFNAFELTYSMYANNPQNSPRFLPANFLEVDRNDREWVYLSLNRRPHPHRQALMIYLHKTEILKYGLVSYPSPKTWVESKYNEEIFRAIPAKHWLHNELISHWPKTKLILPREVDHPDLNINMAMEYETPWPYKASFWNVITETLYAEKTLFISEKIWKPMMNFQPFIVLGNPGTLALLRRLGYLTFSKWIDESYDQIEDPAERFLHAMVQVRHLCAMTPQRLQHQRKEMEFALFHNRNYFLSKKDTALKSYYDSIALAILDDYI